MSTNTNIIPGLSPVDFSSRFDEFFQQDMERSHLIKSLLNNLDEYRTEIRSLRMDLDNERDSRIRYQSHVNSLRDENQRLDNFINSEAYVAVLVDGDGAIFCDDLLKDPQRGAPEAALRLQQAVREYLKDTPLGAERIPIVVRIFVNLNGLAKHLCSANVINSEDAMRTFAELFTNSRAEFDFVNVGYGKENADSKMRKMLQHFSKNFQCKKIFFAGCHDHGYLHELREHAVDQDRIVLLETTPAQPAFRSLNFPITRFDNVFRSEGIRNDSPKRSTILHPPPGLPIPSSLQASSSSFNGTAAPARQTSTTPPTKNEALSPAPPPVPPAAAITQPPLQQRNIISSGNGGISIQYSTTPTATSTYATAGGASGHHNITLPPTSTKTKTKRIIEYNSKNQRIDPPNKYPTNAHDQSTYTEKLGKIRPKGFCNEFYLVGRCTRQTCPMEHEEKLTPGELTIHRFKARTSPCLNGPDCDNYACYLSHHCPQGLNCTRPDCKFSLHFGKGDLDVVVKWHEDRDFPEHV